MSETSNIYVLRNLLANKPEVRSRTITCLLLALASRRVANLRRRDQRMERVDWVLLVSLILVDVLNYSV